MERSTTSKGKLPYRTIKILQNYFVHKYYLIIMFRPGSEIKSDHLGHQSPRFLHLLRVCRDSHESISVRIELLLETDHHDVHASLLTLDVRGHLADVCVVQSRVNLVQDKEGSGLVRVDGEQEGEGRDGFLSAGQV